jgi:spoIIIJ-associated protein
VEWVEVTGRTVEEAKEAALDQLGVAESDAELVILAEPKSGLFGRMRGEARVRARVQPSGPKPKRTRRTRGRTRSPGAAPRDGQRGQGTTDSPETTRAGEQSAAQGDDAEAVGSRPTSSRSGRRRSGSRPAGGDSPAVVSGQAHQNGDGLGEGSARLEEEIGMAEGMTLQEQAEVARGFLEGLLASFGLDGEVETRVVDDETIEVAANGEGLGILVGPRGTTLAAVQDVTRTVVQRQFPSKTDRILVDIASYRERRAAALKRFSEQVASEVKESRSERALEPMSPADRKIVHDTVNALVGVSTRSEGEDPSRYIVIEPAD